jgi:hypothetical protein
MLAPVGLADFLHCVEVGHWDLVFRTAAPDLKKRETRSIIMIKAYEHVQRGGEVVTMCGIMHPSLVEYSCEQSSNAILVSDPSLDCLAGPEKTMQASTSSLF